MIRQIPIRIFIFLCMSLIIFISSLGTGFILMREARNVLLQEKQNKLFALARIMDTGLPTTFDAILKEEGAANAPRQEQIAILNRRLAPFTDMVAASEPGTGVGYYSRKLDAIITYGPSQNLGNTVGRSISPDHKGREVMASNTPMVQTAGLVRGLIMNCMQPISRNGEVIGYIWSNELVNNINQQVRKIYIPFYVTIGFGIIFSFLGTAFIAQAVSSRIREIIRAITVMEKDLDYRIPPIAGELGQIAATINNFAGRLQSRRKLEEQMQRADRLASLGEIAAGVAHEIRNPLTSIKGFVQLIASGMKDDAPQRRYTDIIISETDRLNGMVRELLYYARPSESLKLDIDINHILADTLLLANLNATKRQIEITSEYGDNLPVLKGDQEQIKQLLLNLIINAAQAVGEGGHIHITTKRYGEGIQILIEDDGKGISPEHLPRLFDPFFTTRDNGTGLGLAVAQKIADLHHGEITVSNRKQGGARFTITFPGKSDGTHND